MTSMFNTRVLGSPPKRDPSIRPVPYLPSDHWLNQNLQPAPWGQVPYLDAGTTGTTGTTTTGGLTGGGYPVGSSQNPQLENAISGLLTPGLVPDIARQSAEISAGRGVGGSPAAGSTGVRMSEQNWLQRLGLANTLLSGEASRNLPYQLTPYQQRVLDLQQAAITAGFNSRYFGGRGGGSGYGGGTSGLRPPTATSSPSVVAMGTGFGSGPFGSDSPASSFLSGGGGLGTGGLSDAWTLDDTYEWLGFGNFGSLPGDTSVPLQPEPDLPPDFDWEMWE